MLYLRAYVSICRTVKYSVLEESSSLSTVIQRRNDIDAFPLTICTRIHITFVYISTNAFTTDNASVSSGN